MRLFTKSAFKEALLCPARLNYYHNDEYANQAIADEFLKALAQGGFQVEELAKIYHHVPAENDLKNESGHNDTSARTDELMLQENVVMAEATFKWKNCSVRADIIKKHGNSIELLEIKAKSWGGEKDKWLTKRRNDGEPQGSINNKIRPYVYDVAFQKYVITNYLKERFPDQHFTVRAALLMADKSQVADVDHLNQFFKIKEKDGNTEILKQPGWEVLGDCDPSKQVLTPFFEVDDLCDSIIDGTSPEQTIYLRGYVFKKFVDVMSERYVHRVKKFDRCAVSTECYKCPYFAVVGENKKDGYDECWKELTKNFPQPYRNYTEKPLLEDLWGGGNSKAKGKILQEQNKIFLDQLTQDDLEIRERRDPGLHYNERKRIQVALATGNPSIAGDLADKITEGYYLDVEGLRVEMENWEFPLHMIDFETSAAALPFYKDMSPYEQIAFQFSHHVITKDDQGKYHVSHAHQWINTTSEFPNFDFVRALREAVGTTGSIFRYSNHENTILRAIRVQLLRQKPSDYGELVEFIDSITHPTTEEKKSGVENRSTRDMIDLCDMVKKYFYDPIMVGSNSIKAVLPAVLKSDFLFDKYSKPIYGSVIPSQNFTREQPKKWIEAKGDNPYKHLPQIAEFFPAATQDIVRRVEDSLDEDEESFGDSQINNGGAALWAYSLLQFKLQQPAERDALVKALLQYCELDTLSMVFIWEFFNSYVHICECGDKVR